MESTHWSARDRLLAALSALLFVQLHEVVCWSSVGHLEMIVSLMLPRCTIWVYCEMVDS